MRKARNGALEPIFEFCVCFFPLRWMALNSDTMLLYEFCGKSQSVTCVAHFILMGSQELELGCNVTLVFIIAEMKSVMLLVRIELKIFPQMIWIIAYKCSSRCLLNNT